MTTLSRLVFLAGLFLILRATNGGAVAPPNNDSSDASGNTAGGTSALSSLTTGFSNTAFGSTALTATNGIATITRTAITAVMGSLPLPTKTPEGSPRETTESG